MVELDVGDDAGQWRDDVRRVQASAHARLPNDQIALLLGEITQRHDRHDLEKGRMRCIRSRKLWLAPLVLACSRSLQAVRAGVRVAQAEACGHIVGCSLRLGPAVFDQIFDLTHQPHHVRLADEPAIHLNPFAKRNQMRRGEQPDAQPRRAINAFEHRAGGAFPVRTGDVNEAQLVLRIARQRRELEGVFQPQLQTEQAQVVEEPDGFGVGH